MKFAVYAKIETWCTEDTRSECNLIETQATQGTDPP